MAAWSSAGFGKHKKDFGFAWNNGAATTMFWARNAMRNLVAAPAGKPTTGQVW